MTDAHDNVWGSENLFKFNFHVDGDYTLKIKDGNIVSLMPRADLHDDLVKAADAMAEVVDGFRYGEIPLEFFVAREVYRKAKEKMNG